METKSRKMNFTDLKDMLKQTGEAYGDKTAYILKTEEKGKFREITHKEFRKQINSLGTSLIQMGLKDKRIAVISENRYEWQLAYLSIVAGVGVVVPLDKALPDNELESLILRSQVEAIFYSKKYENIMNKLREKKNTNLRVFISMDLKENENGIYSQQSLVQKGEKLLEDGNKEYLDAKIDADKMGIMLFTSGTTAISKAVMLSHKNLITNITDILNSFELDETDRFLSFLPLHHVFECTVGFLYPISIGGSIAFCEGVKHMADNIKEFQITAMISVPAVFDIMYRRIMKTIEKQGKLPMVNKGIKISKALLKVGIDVRKKIFHEIHDNLGGKIRVLVAGGAALDPETEQGFYDLGFNILQGYGLTETSPVIAAELTKRRRLGSIAGGAALDPETEQGFYDLGFNILQGYGLTETSPVIAAELTKRRRLGSIGKKFPSVEVKIDNPDENGIGELMAKGPSIMLGYYENEEANRAAIEEEGWFHTGDLAKIDEDGFNGIGELMAKGPSIMLGYYENEEANRAAIEEEGWFHTGDLAKIDEDGFIYISGRKKNVIVLNNGKNVFPEELEILLNKVEGIKESFVYEKKESDGDVKICVEIVYDKDLIKELYNIEGEENIKDFLWKKVKEVNNLMPKYKYIREIIITEEELIKTTTLKIKRHEELKKILQM